MNSAAEHSTTGGLNPGGGHISQLLPWSARGHSCPQLAPTGNAVRPVSKQHCHRGCLGRGVSARRRSCGVRALPTKRLGCTSSGYTPSDCYRQPINPGNPIMKTLRYLLPLILVACAGESNAQLRVPACTAYLEPDPEGAHISTRSGITGWQDPGLKVLWFGELKHAGELDCLLVLRLPAGAESRLRLTVAGQSQEAQAKGSGTNSVTVSFKAFDRSEEH